MRYCVLKQRKNVTIFLRMYVRLTNYCHYHREVAKMLREKKTYLDIAEKTGASTATISRVNRSLNYGTEGYDHIFNKMKERESEQ